MHLRVVHSNGSFSFSACKKTSKNMVDKKAKHTVRQKLTCGFSGHLISFGAIFFFYCYPHLLVTLTYFHACHPYMLVALICLAFSACLYPISPVTMTCLTPSSACCPLLALAISHLPLSQAVSPDLICHPILLTTPSVRSPLTCRTQVPVTLSCLSPSPLDCSHLLSKASTSLPPPLFPCV